MIDNYEILNNGVIKQIHKHKIIYDNNYINIRYNSYGEVVNYMSYLRYGYLIGILGYIPDSILDIGYGNGSFLNVCKNTIKKCYGNDVSDYPIPEDCTFIDDIFSKCFEVICFFDSLEHFDDINFISKLNCKYIFISVPECHYFSDEWFKNWKHRREDEHLYHFSKISLENFFSENGYKMINISNIEDIIRKPVDENTNIISAIFKKQNLL